eukprot:g13254.t1
MAMVLVLLLWLCILSGTSAVSPCLDPADATYSCESTLMENYVDSGDLALCFDAAGREGIVSLVLSNNALVTLPEDLFQGLTALESLNLANSGLEELPEGIFQGLTVLESLVLQGNAMSLSEGIFQDLTSLQNLYLHQMPLVTLPEGIFQGLADLTLLHLGATRLVILPGGLFHGLTALEELYMDWNLLTTLPASIFRDLTSLTILVELDDDVTVQFAGGLEVDPYGDECGCSIPDVTGNVCGEQTCTPGPEGYTCVPATSVPATAPEPDVATEAPAAVTPGPEPTSEPTPATTVEVEPPAVGTPVPATSVPASAPEPDVAIESPATVTPGPEPSSEPTPATTETEPPAVGTLAPEAAPRTTPAPSPSSEGSMAPVEDWAATSCAVGSVCPGNQCCHPDLETCGRKYTFCQERDLFNGVRCCAGTDGDPSELNVCAEDSICDAPEAQSTIERTEVWASILGSCVGVAAACAGLYKYCKERGCGRDRD